MSAESIKENAVRKLIQELIVPDLQRIISKGDILEERINSVKNELKADIGRLDERINSLDEKIDTKITALNDKIDSLDNKIDTKITALSEKVDYMNKFNERLFNLIHPSGQKQP